ncbi:hypothetical protein SBI67_26810 [Mycolicibacterium sp. 120266]|uniref:hypothetical protein n=1 Tax=Mycolicibacterium sp. 120266 TaxID=3090601 RepID=UPI00299EFC2A|nr:hypothetical protein [Mycolicibacterium sp. 120266]MDX1875745.1 hypothetical protein [Mycolicibacterium sp. 120266]
MSTYVRVRGVELRYLLTWLLAHEGPATVAELIDRLVRNGFDVGGRPSKTVSDALRWEMGHGRVWPRGRGRYRFGEMPRATEYRIEKRVRGLLVRADALSREAPP